MFIAAHNTITWREEELPMRVTSLENTFRDVKGSYQLLPKKTKKSHGTLILMDPMDTDLQLSPRVLQFPARTNNTLKHCHILLPFVALHVLPSVLNYIQSGLFPIWSYMDITRTGDMSYWHKDIFVRSVPDFFKNAPSVLQHIPADHNSCTSVWLPDGSGMAWTTNIYSGKCLSMAGGVCGLYLPFHLVLATN